jgi:hypothetical protein
MFSSTDNRGRWLVKLGLMGCFGLAVLFAFAGGYLAHRQGWLTQWTRQMPLGDAGPPPGVWKTMRTDGDAAPLPAEMEALEEAVAAIGYMGVTPMQSRLEREGVIIREPAAMPGYNLYVSGHAPEAYLMDMDGNSLHRWRHAYPASWHFRLDTEDFPEGRLFWRRARLLEDGGLLAIFSLRGIIRLDRDSNLIWARQCNAHHDVVTGEDGNFRLLTRKARVIAGLAESPDHAAVDDFITVMTPDGEIIREISIAACFLNSPFAPMMQYAPPKGDFLHTNSLRILDGRHAGVNPAFSKGNILISIRNLHTIAVIDPENETVPWAVTGMWRMQHEATMLENGNILLFDNLGNNGVSRVIEFNPVTLQPAWIWDRDLDSGWCGASARLPNGNTLIVESTNGRVFETTPEKRIVWEFITPHRAGGHNELVAIIPDLYRIPVSFPMDWLERAG